MAPTNAITRPRVRDERKYETARVYEHPRMTRAPAFLSRRVKY